MYKLEKNLKNVEIIIYICYNTTELVDWTLDAGMYAIVKIHWDGGWLEQLPENKTEAINCDGVIDSLDIVLIRNKLC